MVYGRRRVGKTFLIREAYNYDFVFQHTGTYGATRKQQLSDFRESLYNAGMGKCAMPKTWSDAFHLLWDFLKVMPIDGKKKVIFIDELPWMDTPKSNFVRSLDHFWNAWATTRKDTVGKNGSLYAFCMALPNSSDAVKIYSLAKPEGKKVKSVQLLGSKTRLKWKQTNECLSIECPASLPCKTSIVFRID